MLRLRFIAVREKPNSEQIPVGTVTFDRLAVDVHGNTFETSTGTFTVPRTGVYLFVLDGLLDGRGNYCEYMNLRVNGGIVKQMDDGGFGTYHQINGVFASMLNAGDLVTLYAESTTTSVYVNSVYPLTFIGMLIL